MAIHREITIKVAYDESTIDSDKELDETLVHNLSRAIGNGMLSSDEIIVETYSFDIVKVKHG